MARFRLFLLLMFIFNSSSDSKKCENLLPGLDKFLIDIDTTLVSPTELFSSTAAKFHIFEYSCDKDLPFKDEQTKKDYYLADQIDQCNDVDFYREKKSDSLSSSTHEYKNDFDFHADIKVEGSNVSLGINSQIMQSGVRKLSSSYTSYHMMSAQYGTYSVRLKSKQFLKFSDHFQASIDRLSEELTSKTIKQYYDFVENYGTHYFSYGTLGGKYFQETRVKTKLLLSEKTSSILGYSVNTFNSDKPDSPPSRLGGNDNRFVNDTDISFHYSGGVLNKDGNLADWKMSLRRDPWIIGGKTSPVDDLIENNKKRENLKLVYKFHFLMAHLKKIENILFNVDIIGQDEDYDAAKAKYKAALDFMNQIRYDPSKEKNFYKKFIEMVEQMKNGIYLNIQYVEDKTRRLLIAEETKKRLHDLERCFRYHCTEFDDMDGCYRREKRMLWKEFDKLQHDLIGSVMKTYENNMADFVMNSLGEFFNNPHECMIYY